MEPVVRTLNKGLKYSQRCFGYVFAGVRLDSWLDLLNTVFVGNCFCWAILKDRGTSVRPTPTVKENGGGSAFVIMVYR